MHQAQNALLKTLEEPTPSSVFILVTSLPDMLLPTVLSRCPQLRFRPLSLEEMAKALIARGRTATEARAVAATADGSLGQALQASAVELVESRELAQQVLEKAAAQHDPARPVESAQQLMTKPPAGVTEREQLATHLRAMAVLLRDVEVLATGADERDARQRRRQARAGTAVDRRIGASAARARSRRSTARSSRCSATRASRSSPTGWCCSCEHASTPRSSPSS